MRLRRSCFSQNRYFFTNKLFVVFSKMPRGVNEDSNSDSCVPITASFFSNSSQCGMEPIPSAATRYWDKLTVSSTRQIDYQLPTAITTSVFYTRWFVRFEISEQICIRLYRIHTCFYVKFMFQVM